MPSTSVSEYRRRRGRLSLSLTLLMLGVYFGFILLGAFAKGWMGETLLPGLSWGILSGALVIVCAFGLTGVYVRVANAHESEREEFKRGGTP